MGVRTLRIHSLCRAPRNAIWGTRSGVGMRWLWKVYTNTNALGRGKSMWFSLIKSDWEF